MSTATLHSEKTKALLPQLRFPEFDGEWEEKTLFDISKEVSYGMNAAAKEFDGTHKYIRITDIDSESRKFIPNPLTSPEGDIDEKFKLKVNDLLFTRTGASVGKSYLYDSKDGALYYAGFLIKFNIVKADSYFVYSLTLKESYDKWVLVNSMRSGQPGLNAEEYKGLKLNIPTFLEQQKIASFLSAVDEKIQQLSRKKELLSQYKKGVMQQLFSGKLRFKDDNGEDYADWEEKKLGDLGAFKGGGTPSTEISEYWDGDIPWISSSDLIENDISNINVTRFITEKAISESATKLIPVNSVLFISRVGVGKLAVSKRTMCTSQDFANFIPNEIDSFYLAYYFMKNNNLLSSYAQGTSIKGFTSGDLKSIKVSCPVLEEQQKIANFLSSIDAKIENVNGEIGKTQLFKKGLLQQMFV